MDRLIFQVIDDLRASGSSIHKTNVLRTNIDNIKFKKFLQYILSSNTYYMKGLHTVDYGQEPDALFYQFLDRMMLKGSANQKDRAEAEALLSVYGKYLNMVLDKHLDCGINVKSVNDVYGKGFIYVFGAQKASTLNLGGKTKPNEVGPSDIQFPRLVQTKYDGFGTTIVVSPDNKVTYYNSSGKRFKLIDNQCFKDAKPGVYFAEMMGPNRLGKLGHRKYSAVQTTYINNTKKLIPTMEKPVWRIFNYVPYEDFLKGTCKMPFMQRWYWLVDSIPMKFLAESIEVENMEQLMDYAKSVVKDGWEGVVSGSFDQTWNNDKKRRHTLFKWKLRPTMDLLITDELEGTRSNEGLIGSFALADSTGRYVGNVGSGITDDMRPNWGMYIGKVCEVEFEQISPDGMVIQPVLLHIREEGKEPEEVFIGESNV